MKKKTIIALLIVIALAVSVSFAGCGKESGDKSDVTEKETVSETTAETSTEKTEETTEAIKAEDENFFDNAVFVGDSVTMGLRNYVSSQRNSGDECLGCARFLTAGSMSYTNTIMDIGAENSIHPTYQGKEMRIEDALAEMDAEKVFIMLGMNDFCAFPTSDTGIENAEKNIAKIKEKNPEIEIYIESVTPTLNDDRRFCNANIDEFNGRLKTLCEETDCTYVDVESVMKDSNGLLIASYCSDPEGKGVHMTFDGCKAWVDYLNEQFN